MAVLKGYDIKLSPRSVDELKQLSRRLSYDRNQDIGWPDLVRLGIEWVLSAEGDPAKVPAMNNQKEATPGARWRCGCRRTGMMRRVARTPSK